jgi:hypothetical protein
MGLITLSKILLTMVFKTSLTMKQQNVWNSVSFAIYVVFGICRWVQSCVIWCFFVNFVQVLPSCNKIIPMTYFHHPLNKQIDLMLMNFDVFFLLYIQNHL